MRDSLVYLIAAGLFAAATGVNVGSNRSIGVADALLLGTALLMAGLAIRARRTS